MLIIFDLDDTLIDTSGCITPLKLEEALKQMVASGLVVTDFEGALVLLKRLDAASEKGENTLREFLDLHDADPDFLKIGLRVLYGGAPSSFYVDPIEGVRETLQELSLAHTLAVVTIGQEEFQRKKMEKAGIDSSLFSKIIVTGENNKGQHYQVLTKEFSCHPSQVIVCGDRYHNDLLPAQELGFTTVHMQWGRGCRASQKEKPVDYRIARFQEIREIIYHLSSI